MKKVLFYFLLILVLSLAAVFVGAALVQSASVTLAWDANDPPLDGYNLFQRSEGETFNYKTPVNAELITGTTYAVKDLAPGKYFFAVRAVNGVIVSEDSNHIEHIVADPPEVISWAQLAAQLARIEANQAAILELLNSVDVPDATPAAVLCGNPASMKVHKDRHWCGDTAVRFDDMPAAEAAGYEKCGFCRP